MLKGICQKSTPPCNTVVMSYFIIFSYILQSLFPVRLSDYPSNFRCLFTMNIPAACRIVYISLFQIYELSLVLCIWQVLNHIMIFSWYLPLFQHAPLLLIESLFFLPEPALSGCEIIAPPLSPVSCIVALSYIRQVKHFCICVLPVYYLLLTEEIFTLGIPCRLCNDWYKVDLPAPLTPAIKIYFFTKRDSFLLPVSASFAEENHPPFHKNFFVLLFRPPIQVVKYLLAAVFVYPHRFFHIF